MVADAAGPPRLVLLLEHALASLPLVEALLARLPRVQVHAVVQGRLGLELAQTLQPALILLGLEMPNLGGQTVLRRLQADPCTRAIPVLTFGGPDTAALGAALLLQGTRGHFPLPLDVPQVLARIEALLG
jgi:CheY-like chemotaxis protein